MMVKNEKFREITMHNSHLRTIGYFDDIRLSRNNSMSVNVSGLLTHNHQGSRWQIHNYWLSTIQIIHMNKIHNHIRAQ